MDPFCSRWMLAYGFLTRYGDTKQGSVGDFVSALTGSHGALVEGYVMAEIESFESEVGEWLLMKAGPDELRALVHRSDGNPDPGVTLFWHGRFDASKMTEFHKIAAGQVSEGSSDSRRSRILIYDRQSGEQRTIHVPTLPIFGRTQPDEAAYDNADFVRFEQLAIGQDGGERPVLVLWCVVDDDLRIRVESDSTGLLMQPRHLTGLRPAVAELISRTSAVPQSLGGLVAILEELEAHLRPDATPIAVAA